MSDQPEIRPVLNLDESTWEGWFNSFILWTAQNPWQFLTNVLLCLSPFFLISLILSWKLSKALEEERKEKKIKAKRSAQISKTRSERLHKKQALKESWWRVPISIQWCWNFLQRKIVLFICQIYKSDFISDVRNVTRVQSSGKRELFTVAREFLVFVSNVV